MTPMAYDCIQYAYEAADVLSTEIGAACIKFKTEDEYLLGIIEHVKDIEKDPEDYLDFWNLLDNTDIGEFKRKIKALRVHIEKTIDTPFKRRGKPMW